VEEEFIRLVQVLGWVKKIEHHNAWLELSLADREIGIPEIVRLARGKGFIISSINSHKPSLNDVLLHYTGKRIEQE
jgi:ABC-2 type transport system ATP-binding protein